MKKFNVLILVSSICSLAVTLSACSDSGKSSSTPPAPPIESVQPTEVRTARVRPDAYLLSTEVPNESVLQVKEPLQIHIERATRSGKVIIAYFDREGVHAYGPGSDGWARSYEPSVTTTNRICSLTLDAALATAGASAEGIVTIPVADLLLQGKLIHKKLRAENGRVTFKVTSAQTPLVKSITCDKTDVKEIEKDIFGDKIQFLIPQPSVPTAKPVPQPAPANAGPRN